MANADSTIRVNIIGDAKSLQRAADQAEKAGKGIGSTFKKIGAGIGALFVANEVVDFVDSSLNEFDRLGDATTRLESQLGDLAQPLIDNAGHFTDLGQSAQDMLELEARFADIATSAGALDAAIAPAAESAAETAAAMALLTDTDAATILDQIGKAAAGSDRVLKDLGISLTDAEVEARALRDTGKGTADELTRSELAAASLSLVLEKLAPRITDVTDASADLDQKQSQLQAKFETLSAKVGGFVEGPLNAMLDALLDGIEDWEFIAAAIDDADEEIREFLTPLARAIDLLRTLGSLLPGGSLGRDIGTNIGNSIRNQGSSGFDQSDLQSAGGVTINVNGGDPVEVERAVQKALNSFNRRNNL